MPARKPTHLIQRHETAAETEARVARDVALRPKSGLPASAPAQLKEHPTASAIWRRMMRLYGEIEAQVVSRLDQDLLVDYCILAEQIVELDKMRRASYKVWEMMHQAWEEMEADMPIEVKLETAMKLQGALSEVIKLDGRADRKRSLLLQMRQSLYLTPRARAGAIPAQKEIPEPPDALETLLNDVSNFVNDQR